MNTSNTILRPNVLFISFDDLNHYAGFLERRPSALTPHMDALAARSMVFEHAYCQAPICNPSRASLMSGLLPSTTGVYGNRQPFRLSPPWQCWLGRAPTGPSTPRFAPASV